MAYVIVEGKTYSFSLHASEKFSKKPLISIEWIELAMEDPDEIASSPSGATEYKKNIEEVASWLIVVANEDRALIITLYWTSSCKA